MSTTEGPKFDYNAYFDKHGLDPLKIHRGPAEREKRLQAAMERKRIAQKEESCLTNTTEGPEFDYNAYFDKHGLDPLKIHRGPAEREKHLQAAMERKRIAQNKQSEGAGKHGKSNTD